MAVLSQAMAVMQPVDSLKPPVALSYKMTISEKKVWKSLTRAWFEASNYSTLPADIQIQFVHEIMKEELMKAISYQFQDNHNYKNYIQFADDEFISYNTQGNNLTRLLNMKEKPSDKMLIFCEKALEYFTLNDY